MHKRLLAIILISTATFLTAQGQKLELKNNLLALRFAPSDGHLQSMTDSATSTNFLEHGADNTPLWTIDFMPGTTPATLNASAAKSFRTKPLRTAGPGLKLIWDKFELPSAHQLRIEATVELDVTVPNSRWKIQLCRHSADRPSFLLRRHRGTSINHRGKGTE